MFQVKRFEGNNEQTINDWLKQNPDKQPVSISMVSLHDRYGNGEICNQWVDTIIIYRTMEEQTNA